MQNFANERVRCHTPRPPQPQFCTNSNCYQASSTALLEPYPRPQVDEAESPLCDPQLNEVDEQSSSVESYGKVDHGSQSSTTYSAEGPPHMPPIDGAQGYMPSFSQHNYLVGLPQENGVFQTSEDSRSGNTAFLQRGRHMGPTAFDLGNNGHDTFSWESSTTLPSGFEPPYVDHMSPDLQAALRADRRSSLERHLQLDTSSPATIQTPLVPRSFANHANTTDRQVNPLDPATADGMDLSLNSPFDGGILDWPHGNGRIDLAGTRRRISMDSGLPNNARSRAHNRHIGPSVSEHRRHSQSSYQSVAQHHRAPAFQSLAFQPQDQGARRGIRASTSPAQNVISYGITSLNNDEFARNIQELIEGVQANNSPAGNPETYLHPTWQPAHRAFSETYGDDKSDISDEEVPQRPHIAPGDQHRVPNRGYKREPSSDSPSTNMPQARNKRKKRQFSAEERAEISRKRKTGACKECRGAKRKVYESSQPSLYQCQ